MLHLQNPPLYIKNYHPLDLAGDAVWIPVPNSCFSVGVLELYYNIDTALAAWGITPVRKKSGEHIMHPSDPAVGKYILPDGWTIRHHRFAREWSIHDQNDRRRLAIRYDPKEFVSSTLATPFDMQTRISGSEVPPNDWWNEVTHFGKVVFKSEAVNPNTPEIQRARAEMENHIFFAQVFHPQLNSLLAPGQEAARQFMTESFPLFPADPTAYWE